MNIDSSDFVKGKHVFVFGSNLAGVHGAGAAAFAKRKHGAEWGVGIGHRGSSYALPTKDRQIESLSLEEVQDHVDTFINYAIEHPELVFRVTQIGCGLAGFTKEEIAPLFKEAPENCHFDTAWYPLLGDKWSYWGTA